MPRHGISIKKRVAKNGEETFHIRFSNGGRPVRETFNSEQEAQDRIAEIEYLRKLSRLPAEQRAAIVLIDDMIVDWWAAQKESWKPGTLKAYRSTFSNWVDPYLTGKPLGSFNLDAADRYRAALLADGAGIPTIIKVEAILEGAWNWAIKRPESYGISSNPFAAANRIEHTPRTPDEPATLDDVMNLWKKLGPLDGLALLLISVLTLRQQECFCLRWRDLIDRDGHVRKVLSVRYSISGGVIVDGAKSKAGVRELEIPEPLRSLIAEVYLAWGKPSREREIFITSRNERMTHKVFNQNRIAPVQRYLGYVRKNASGEPILIKQGKFKGKQEVLYTPHDFRDVAAAIRIEAGYDLDSLKYDMGHSSITTTERAYWAAVKRMKGKKPTPIAEQLRAARKKAGEPEWIGRVAEIDSDWLDDDAFEVERVSIA